MRTFRLDGIETRYGLIQAPLAGYSTSPYRLWMRRHGAEVVFSEMISADGILRAPEKQKRYFDFTPEERPIALQLFGSDPETIGKAAGYLAGMRPDIIDLNMGCPVRKVTKTGAGAALMEDPGLAEELAASAVAAAPGIYLTVKCRLDIGRGERLAPLLERFARAGVFAVTLHPRTREEGFRGKADRIVFRRLADAAPLPMIYSGDVDSGQEAAKAYEETGASAIMIGRAAIANPWIFAEAAAAIEGKEYIPPSWAEKAVEFLDFRNELLSLFGEKKGLLEIRKFAGHLLGGERGSRRYVQEFYRAKDAGGQDAAIYAFVKSVV